MVLNELFLASTMGLKWTQRGQHGNTIAHHHGACAVPFGLGASALVSPSSADICSLLNRVSVVVSIVSNRQDFDGQPHRD